jgi:hypothetical protein
MSKKIGYFHTKHQDLYIIIRVEYVNGKEFVVGVTVFRGSGFWVQGSAPPLGGSDQSDQKRN